MELAAIRQRTEDLFSVAPFLKQISNQGDYESALLMVDDLIEDYAQFKPVIDLAAAEIEKWEGKADEFREFNQIIEHSDSGLAVLRTLMDQHNLNTTDFQQEIGGKSTVSMILNNKRNLTKDHIKALCHRFNISPELFF